MRCLENCFQSILEKLILCETKVLMGVLTVITNGSLLKKSSRELHVHEGKRVDETKVRSMVEGDLDGR